MIEAWSARDIERRRLIEEFISMIWELEDEQEKPTASMELASLIIEYLRSRLDSTIIVNDIKHSSGIFHIFFDRLLPKIKNFARADEECDAMIGRLLKNLIEHPLGRFEAALTSIEVNNPQLIFNAPKATAEVEMPDDE